MCLLTINKVLVVTLIVSGWIKYPNLFYDLPESIAQSNEIGEVVRSNKIYGEKV